MFAFALWDRQERQLHLVRDRFGEKPLYYGWAGRDFVFASELKAIRCHPEFDAEIDRRALRPSRRGPTSRRRSVIYKQIVQARAGLRPDACRRSTRSTSRPRKATMLRRYWSYGDVVRDGLAEPFADEDEALAALEAALDAAIDGQSVADVPVGAFLSGGIDSSTVIALYQERSAHAGPDLTRSGSRKPAITRPTTRARSRRISAPIHHEHIVTAAEARDVIPLLPAIYDEPFADSSQIPTFIVSRFARRDVTVALTGDGGDELFAGYNRHVSAPAMWNAIRHVPAAAARRGRRDAWPAAVALLVGGGLDHARRKLARHLGAKIQKALRTAGHARDFGDIYDAFLDEWAGEASPVIGGEATAATRSGDRRRRPCATMHARRDRLFARRHPGQGRPRLDGGQPRDPGAVPRPSRRGGRRADPAGDESRGREGQADPAQGTVQARRREALFDRPKAGFAVPVGTWIKGPLRDWAEALLDPSGD